MHRRTFVISLFFAACPLLVAAGRTGDPATSEPVPTSVTFDPLLGTVIATSGDAITWTRFDLDRSRIGREEPIYHSRCYIQHLSGEPALLSRGGFSRGVEEPAAILADDTLLVWRPDPIHQLDSLLWLHGGAVQRRVPLKIDGAAPAVRAIFPDGIVAETTKEIWWIPLRDGHVNVLARTKMGSGESLGLTRFKNQIAWEDLTGWPRGSGDAPKSKYVIYIFDVAHETTRAVKVTGKGIRMPYYVLAFDGQYAIDGNNIINVVTGNGRALNGYFEAIGIINNLAYGVKRTYDAFELQAMRLDQPDRREAIRRIEKSKLSPRQPSAADTIPNKTLFFVDGDALYAWNGTTWENILAKR